MKGLNWLRNDKVIQKCILFTEYFFLIIIYNLDFKFFFKMRNNIHDLQLRIICFNFKLFKIVKTRRLSFFFSLYFSFFLGDKSSYDRMFTDNIQ